MTNSLLAGLAGVSIALVVQRLALRKHKKSARSTLQAFQFHDARDRLQELAISGAIEPDSPTYRFLWMAINLAIKNAGAMRLRDVMRVASEVDREAREQYQQLVEDLEDQPESVRDLYVSVMHTLTETLIANDVLVRLGYRVGMTVGHLTGGMRQLGATVLRLMDRVAEVVAPARTEAVKQARSLEQLRLRISDTN